MPVLLFANGEIEDVEWIRPFLENAPVIIAADGGTRHLYQLGTPPQVVVGDMDSLTADLRRWLEAFDVQFITHPPAKDETDLELALLFARQYGREIYLFGALGGRLDQTLGNIFLLAHPALHGVDILLMAERERAWLVDGQCEITGEPGDVVSLVPLGGDVVVGRTEGLRWPLVEETLAFGPARGISNELTAVTATVEVTSGKLLCIHAQHL